MVVVSDCNDVDNEDEAIVVFSVLTSGNLFRVVVETVVDVLVVVDTELDAVMVVLSDTLASELKDRKINRSRVNK